jgi:hypothetical protein
MLEMAREGLSRWGVWLLPLIFEVTPYLYAHPAPVVFLSDANGAVGSNSLFNEPRRLVALSGRVPLFGRRKELSEIGVPGQGTAESS